jgi:drug/metabolite transporter (DMT)-like permease
LRSLPLARDPHHRTGLLLVFLGFVCFSTGGIILRFIQTEDGWAILFWRSIPWLVAIAAFLTWRNGSVMRPLRTAGPTGFLVGACVAGAASGYIFGVKHTTVANVAFTFSATPFLAALLGWVVLRERVAPRTMAAIAVALAGVGLMVGDGLSSGGWLGNLMALGAACSFATMLVLLRRAGQVDMLPASVWGAVVSIGIGGALAHSLALSVGDLFWCAVFGTVNMTAGLALVTLGARHLPAAETALMQLTESILAPVWVWLVFAEEPGSLTLVGGLVVLGAVTWQAASAAIAGRAADPP